MPNSAAWWFFNTDFHIVKFLSQKFLFQVLGYKVCAVKRAVVAGQSICPSLAFRLSSFMLQCCTKAE